MHKLITVLLFSILSISVIHSQNNLIGGGLGVNLIVLEKGGQIGLPLYLSFCVSLNKSLELEFRPGISAAEYYNGIELGSYLKIFLKEQFFYLSLGVKFHKNWEYGTTSTHVRNDLYFLPSIGIGSRTKVDRTFLTFELLYQKPFPNGLTYSIVRNQYIYKEDFWGVVSLNICFSWQI
jgi:hypothetical protein